MGRRRLPPYDEGQMRNDEIVGLIGALFGLVCILGLGGVIAFMHFLYTLPWR